MLYGWAAGRSARLRGRQQIVIAAVTGMLGLAMIVLKDIVLVYPH